jgi:hypothetical protein
MKKILLFLLIASTAFATYTQKQVSDMLDRNFNPFRQDIVDGTHTSGSPQTIVSGTPVRFSVDGAVRNSATGPAYMTNRWDTVNSKIAASTEYDGPTYVADLSWTFDPASASSGRATITVWIDDAIPKLIGTYTIAYKGPSAEQNGTVVTWYWGTDAGYDAKNDGVYFEIEFDDAGSLYDKSVVIYNTQ